MYSDRRDFLHRLAVGAATVASAPSLLRAAPRTHDTLGAPTHSTAAEFGDAEFDDAEFGDAAFDEAAFDEAEFEDAMLAAADPEWDTSWTKKLTGKHKVLFDVPGANGGAGVFRAGLWARQYTDVFKTTPADLSPVIVLRHEGIVLAMQQTFWDTYSVGKRSKIKDGNDKKTTHNPVLAKPLAEGEKPRPFDALMLEQQIARGVVVLACNMAFGLCVATVMKADKLDAAPASEKAKSMIIPGIILQPSGIFANVLAQQSGCVFIAAS